MTLHAEKKALKNALISTGYVYINDIRTEDEFLSVVQDVGKIVPQYDNQLVWSIKAEKRFENTYHSKNNKELMPHTECYEYNSLPPRYLALWCKEPGNEGEGFTWLSNLMPFFDMIPAGKKKELENIPLRYFSTAGLQEENIGKEAWHPFLSYAPDGTPLVRFSYTCMDYSALADFSDLRDELMTFINANAIKIAWKKNALLIWNNFRLVHSRSGYSNYNRELRRVWLVED
ncbi:TauD/TfdA family dioxygenase [Erwinia mallotivora]|uniref:TauD/TfdA family dioxygenase n=1 Tax=Erwinia mallotivora TaxID=69222 RepID=UPI0021BE0BB3|nr:TauD/TfdA family dioxygenase [Erwinia mallotivora]